MSDLQIQLFGDFQIQHRGIPLDGFDAPRLQSLLAYLLLHVGAPQSRKHIAFLIWQDSTEQQAHGNLRNLLHRLKKLLPDADRYLLADSQTLEWAADAPFTADVVTFQHLLRDNPAPTAASLAQAVSLYGGDLLPSCYDEWILPEREHLREQYITALSRLVDLHDANGDHQSAILYARRLIQADPLSEANYRHLMTLYARVGDRANLVRVYQTCVTVLKRELDTEPGALTRETFEQLRRRESPVERVPTTAPPPASNLPVPLTSFIGRTRELVEIQTLLERARLVTLTGVGGGGKTRLAIRAAQNAAAKFPDGVWFTDFAPLTDPIDVPRAIALVFGLNDRSGTSPTDLLTNLLRERALLLVLDNCEHLLPACAALAATLLRAAPRLRILATSREPLNLPGEALIVVPPLSLPDANEHSPDKTQTSDAVRLFVERAQFSLPTFSLTRENLPHVIQICRRLDGIPLAIELAAARIRTLTPKQIADRLDDALAVLTRGSAGMPARHQTMRAVLDWSDALLAGQEEALFPRLSVFSGSFTLDAAEQVCSNSGSSQTQHNVLDLLSNLIDKSLVTTIDLSGDHEARYRLLEPIRQYADEKLRSLGEHPIWAARHLAWCISLAQETEPALESAGQVTALARLEREHDNLRAALDFALHSGAYEQGLHLAVLLERFWLIGGHAIEGRTWLHQLLGLENSESMHRIAAAISPPIHARALSLAGALAARQNDPGAEAYYIESLRIWQSLDNSAGIATVLRNQAEVVRMRGDYARAVELHTASLNLWRELNNPKGIASVLGSLGATYSERGEYDRAIEHYREGLTLALALGDVWLIAIYKNNLGVALRDRDPDQADVYFRETLVLRSSLGDQFGIAISLRNLGEIALKRQDWQAARTNFQASLRLNQNIHNDKGVADCLIGLAWVEHAHSNYERAAQFLGISERLRDSIHIPVPKDDRAELDDLMSRLESALGTAAFHTALAHGRTLPGDRSLALALAG